MKQSITFQNIPYKDAFKPMNQCSHLKENQTYPNVLTDLFKSWKKDLTI